MLEETLVVVTRNNIPQLGDLMDLQDTVFETTEWIQRAVDGDRVEAVVKKL
jgi:hypothetical protein